MKRYLSLAALLGLMGLAPALASAQSCTATLTPCTTGATAARITITIGPAFALNVAPGTTALSPPSAADFNTGYVQTTGPTATMRSNRSWTLSISASAATWTGVTTQTEPAWTAKPASDLQWSTAPGGPFVPMTTTPAAVSTGAATAGSGVTLFYRTNYSWLTDTPGNYSIQLVITMTAP
jgi:hypothetical protein